MEKTTTLMKNRYTLAEHYAGIEDTFVPALGVTIIYPAEDGVQKMKLGDGQTTLANLPWVGGVGSGGGGTGTSYTVDATSILTLSGTTLGTDGVKKGTGKNAIAIQTGVASAKNAIAIGTAEIPSDFKTLAGSFTAAAPEAAAEASFVAGTSSKAVSTGGMSLGIANTAGITGYYWFSAAAATVTIDGVSTPATEIQLSTKDKSLLNWEPDIPTSLDWATGDLISIVNNAKYPAVSTIYSVNKSTGKIIVVPALPFTARETVIVKAPDDFTIFAIHRDYNESTNRSTITPRTGTVELGWGAQVFGAMNMGAGTFSQTFGWNNLTAGDFGATFGRDNITGYSGLSSGMNNENVTVCSAVFGNSNKALYNPITGNGNGSNLISGENNITSAWNAAAIGRQLRATTNAQLVAGQFNAVTDERATFVVGNGNVGAKAESGYTGEVLDGLKVLRSNAFTVYHSGRIEAGKSTTTTDSGKTLVTLDLIKGTGANVGSNVFSLGINNTYGHFDGSSVGATTNAAESLIVGNSNTAHGNQILIAGYGNKVGVNQGVALGDGNTVTGAQGFAANFKNTVAGASGAAFGESNTVSGQNSAAFGLRNKVLVVAGTSNSGKNNMIGGEDNTSSNWNNAAFGRCLDADTSALTVVGQFNKTPSARAMFIVGNGNVNITGVEKTTTTNQTATAYSRRNAFVAYYDGRCAVGANPVDALDVATKQYVDSHSGGVSIDDFDSNQFTESNGIISLNLNYLLEQEW